MSTKACSQCKEILPFSSFAYKNKTKGKLTAHCRACQKKYARKHYSENTEKIKKRAYTQKKQARQRNKEYIFQYLLAHPCVDCGESDPIVLEFDHQDPSVKSCNIGDAAHRAHSVEKLKSEIEKCDVRCANCHKRKTAKQFNWWKHRQAL